MGSVFSCTAPVSSSARDSLDISPSTRMATGLTHLGATFRTSTGGSVETAAPAAVKAPPTAEEVIPGADQFRIAIVHTEWNTSIISALLDGAIAELKRHGLADEHIQIVKVRCSCSRVRFQLARHARHSLSLAPIYFTPPPVFSGPRRF